MKRSVQINGEKTSVSLEDVFWEAFVHEAKARHMTQAALATQIYHSRGGANLSSAIRVYLFQQRRTAA